MSEPSDANRPGRQGKRRWPWLLAALLLAVLGSLALWAYDSIFGHAPIAHRHVPPGTSIALRADAVQILTFAPVRAHLWPLLLDSPGDEEEDRGRRRRRIAETTGVDIPLDLREVVIASLDGRSWVAIVSGAIEPGRFVKGVSQVLEEEGIDSWALEGELLVHDLGPALGQAADGTIVLGTQIDITRAALPLSREDATVPLDTEGALSFWIGDSAYAAALGLLPRALPGKAELAQIEQLAGDVTLSDEPQVNLRLVPRDGLGADVLAQRLEGAIGKLSLATRLVPHDMYGAKQALADTSIRADRGIVQVSAPWSAAAIDAALAQLATVIRAGRKLGASR